MQEEKRGEEGEMDQIQRGSPASGHLESQKGKREQGRGDTMFNETAW